VAKVVPFTQARAQLSELLDDVETRHEHVVVTRNGRPIAVVLSTEEWEAIEETLDILQDEETLEALGESEADVKAGRVTPLSDVRRTLGLG
jgi:prevent-host-death family protein